MGAKALRIALIAPPFLRVPPNAQGDFHYGGLEVIVADLGECLAKMGHEVTVFAANGSKVAGCTVYEYGDPPQTIDVNWGRWEEMAYMEYCEEISRDFDIIHSHTWYGHEYAVKHFHIKLNMCHTHHGGRGRSLVHWKNLLYPRANLNLFAISRWMSDVYRKTGLNSKVVYNGICLQKYPYQPRKSNRLIFIGRLDSFKQPLLAIKVAEAAGLSIDVIGGTWVKDKAYLELVRSRHNGKNVRIHENLPHNEKVKLLMNARALLFPSKMGEPFGLVACEAMSCGTPVIALKDGAIPEVVKHGETGYICKNFSDMVKATFKIDKIQPEDCRHHVQQKFSRHKMAANYVRFYRRITGGQSW